MARMIIQGESGIWCGQVHIIRRDKVVVQQVAGHRIKGQDPFAGLLVCSILAGIRYNVEIFKKAAFACFSPPGNL